MTHLLQLGTPGTSAGYMQPKLSNKFIVTFEGIGGAADSQPLTRQLVSTAKPSLGFNEIELNRYNSKAFVAGKYNWEPIDIIIEDSIDNGAGIVIQQQIEKQISLTATGAAPLGLNAAVSGGAYKFTTNILTTTGQGSDAGVPTDVIEKWVLQGCWIMNYTGGDLSYEDDAPTQITLSIRFDHAYQEFNNIAEPASALVGE